MLCSISGQPPKEPVVSTKSGRIFERRLLAKYVEANGKDPISEEPMTKDDVVVVTADPAIKPRPVNATSLPSMLQMFQNEWDVAMLEIFSLKRQLDTVRQELAQSLYQHDAACRVIARLVKERDEARAALGNAQVAAASASASMEIDITPTGIPQQVKDNMQRVSQELSRGRKQRRVPESLAPPEAIQAYTAQSSHPVHKASQPGILCLDIHPKTQNLVVTGGVDTYAKVFDRTSGKVIGSLGGHTKKVTDVLFHPEHDMVFSASADKTVKMWRRGNDGQYFSAYTLKGVHSAPVTGLALHASGDYLVSASGDKTWAFYDVGSGRTMVKVADAQVDASYTCVNFHPDGLILGTGSADNLVRIWDVKSQATAATFEGHKAPISSISFSENGYYLATSDSSGAVKLWDLRKLRNFHSIAVEKTVSAVSWDDSGSYLAVAGQDIRVFSGRNLQPVATYGDHTGTVTDVKFGQDARFLASTSMDRTLKFFS